MAIALQVVYPIGDDTHFDYDYYNDTHFKLVMEHMGPHHDSVLVTKGLAGGPDTPPPYYAIFTITFKDQTALDAALAASAPVLADIPNYTNTKPSMLIGEVVV